MYKFLAVITLAAALAGCIAGCRSTKKIRKELAVPSRIPRDTVQTPADTMKAAPVVDRHADSMAVIQQSLGLLERTRVDFQTFSAKTKVHYVGNDGREYDFNAFIHIRKDSMIWVSINVALGIEAFRILITPDSVKVLDKLKKVARVRSVSYLQEDIQLPVDFKAVQDLLIGNPVYFDTSNILFYKRNATGISLVSVGPLFKNFLTMNANDNTLSHCKLDDVDPSRSRTCDLSYDDYSFRDSVWFSSFRRITVAEKSKTDIELEYKQYKFNEPLSFSFTIPRNYKRR